MHRIRSLEQLQRKPNSDNYAFFGVFSASSKTREAVQANILELIANAHELVSKDNEEEVYQLNIDLFKWS